MELRPELLPPPLDEEQVQRLTELASQLDGCEESESQQLVDEFNRNAQTRLTFRDFQGIDAATDHETWVRTVLSLPAARAIPDITREELVEVVTRIGECQGAEHEVSFWLSLLEANVPDPAVSDLIFWPNHYFKNEDLSELTPEQVVDTALAYVPSTLAPPGLKRVR